MRRARDLTAAAALALLVVVLYRKVLRLWWTYDDGYMLHGIFDHRIADWFFNGAVWPQKLYTPLVMVWFEADLAAFGLDPARWYVVHLVSIALSAIAFFFALREWFPTWTAAAGATLYVAAVPLCALAAVLGGIHYLVGIALGSLATIFYVRGVRGDRFALSIVSALIYFIGMLAKETVAPLAILLIFLPDRDARTRLRHAIPLAIALAVYMFWRRAVIGTFLGGYGWAVDRGELPALLLSLPKKIVLASAGTGVAPGLALIAIMLIGVVLALRGKRAAILFVVAMALATGPVLPVSKEMQRRYALMPWLAWSVAFIAGAELLRRRRDDGAPASRRLAGRRPGALGATLLTVVPLLAIVANRQEWRAEYGRTLRMSEEARFFVDMPPDSYLRLPIVPPAAMGELNWLKTAQLGKPGGAMWFHDDYFLCTTDVAGKRAWEFVPERRAIVEITAELPQIARRHCDSIRVDAPLRADFDYHGGALFWTFGPYDKGRWRVLLANGIQAFDVPRKDGFRLPEMPGITLRVRYDSPEGWTSYSPDIALDFVKQPQFTWRR